jgi:hypothetical protein
MISNISERNTIITNHLIGFIPNDVTKIICDYEKSINIKIALLKKLNDLEQTGVILTRKYDLYSDISMIYYEYKLQCACMVAGNNYEKMQEIELIKELMNTIERNNNKSYI